jgi:FixJ family two-component response regulator
MIPDPGAGRYPSYSGADTRHRQRLFCSASGKTSGCELQVISIIDDDASVRAATDNLLRSLGYAVCTFISAEEFLLSAHVNETSCVIADVQMPGMSGVDLQARLLTQGHRVPFIFITAFPEKVIRAQALEAGAICFLTKPFDRVTLIRCLDTALKRHSGGAGE